tara:strand:+ start:298 stop:540 length:243 start_codon:yes stop_codon:yes gene_type:complete
MSWQEILKVSDEDLTDAVETVFSDSDNNEDAEKLLILMFREEIIRPFIIAYNIKEKEKRGHGKVIEGGASKKHMRSRWKK